MTLFRLTSALFFGLLLYGTAQANITEADPELRSRLIEAIRESTSFNDRFAAEVWLMDMSKRLERRIPDPLARLELLRTVHREATRSELPPELVLAVIQVESAFDRWAISSVGAQGLMQIMPFWLKEIGHPDDNLFHIKTNLRMGCTILRFYLDKEKGNLTRALARYNGSLHIKPNRYANKVFRALRRNWFVR
ncbi:MAG TPA: lytic transglycosylase domain-containing protein [Gammaproteobacteria bacterium]|nr:lytic transglycosylase domain-containing protein [Gammaproteobacteria bacterium]